MLSPGGIVATAFLCGLTVAVLVFSILWIVGSVRSNRFCSSDAYCKRGMSTSAILMWSLLAFVLTTLLIFLLIPMPCNNSQ